MHYGCARRPPEAGGQPEAYFILTKVHPERSVTERERMAPLGF
jgi:hypothetical protein